MIQHGRMNSNAQHFHYQTWNIFITGYCKNSFLKSAMCLVQAETTKMKSLLMFINLQKWAEVCYGDLHNPWDHLRELRDVLQCRHSQGESLMLWWARLPDPLSHQLGRLEPSILWDLSPSSVAFRRSYPDWFSWILPWLFGLALSTTCL